MYSARCAACLLLCQSTHPVLTQYVLLTGNICFMQQNATKYTHVPLFPTLDSHALAARQATHVHVHTMFSSLHVGVVIILDFFDRRLDLDLRRQQLVSELSSNKRKQVAEYYRSSNVQLSKQQHACCFPPTICSRNAEAAAAYPCVRRLLIGDQSNAVGSNVLTEAAAQRPPAHSAAQAPARTG